MLEPQVFAQVADILERNGWVQEARALTLSSKQVMVEFGKFHFFQRDKAIPGKKDRVMRKRSTAHPLQALEDTMHSAWKRRCVASSILYEGHTFLPQMCITHTSTLEMSEFFAMYREDIKGKLNLAREAHPDAKYTFHIVYRFNVMQVCTKIL
jgi:hypothetical protein